MTLTSKIKIIVSIIIAALLMAVIAYAVWYSYDRHEKIAHDEQCSGKPSCVYEIVPPTLIEKYTGKQPASLVSISGCDQSATTTDCSSIISQPSATTTPSETFPVGGIVADPNPRASAPAGYMAFKDNQWNVTFDLPPDWTPRVLPEGDGTQSMTSPDFADPLGTMKGAYIHYSVLAPPDTFKGNPNGYMDLLKQGMNWSTITVSGHVGYITKNGQGYTMVVAQISDNEFASVSFVDPANEYSAAFDVFLASFKYYEK